MQPAPTAGSATVLVLAPVGRDAALTDALFGQAGIAAHVVTSVEEIAERLDDDSEVGVLLLTEEGLGGQQPMLLRAALDTQPAWSELPLLLFVRGGRSQSQLLPMLDAFGPSANVTLLERPVRPTTLVSVVRSALKARQRQFEVRDLLDQLQHLNETLEERVVARTAEVRRLAAELTLAEQRERERLATVLHDHLQQVLFALRMKLELLHTAPDERRDELHHQAAALLADAMGTTRTLTVDLFPPLLQDDGFVVAMEWLASHFESQHGLHVEIHADGPICIARRDVFILLTQSVRELLFNVVKHAETSEAAVALHLNGALSITVSDEGSGFDPAANTDNTSTGLVTLHERLRLLGGTVHLEATEGEGTRVTLTLPASILSLAETGAPLAAPSID